MKQKGSTAVLENRRQRAIYLLNQNYKSEEVAFTLSVGRRSVRRWKATYLKEGKNAIKEKPAGRLQKLPEQTKNILERLLLNGSRAAGFPIDLDACP